MQPPTQRSIDWGPQRAAHLFRRAGFGASPEQIGAAVALGRYGTVDRLLDFPSVSTRPLDELLASFRFDLTTFFGSAFDRSYNQFLDLQRWWYLRLAFSPRPLEEKLTLFWHNHFATSYAKVDLPPLLYNQNQLFRRFAAGSFPQFLLEVAKDPAMLFYLDNNTNVKDAIQENWGRELLELFTMGVNRYTQADVRSAAAAFTGWTTGFEAPYAFMFDESQHDFGPKTFLGQTGNFDGGEILQILAARSETAAFVTTKLARFFIGWDPSGPLARHLRRTYMDTGGSIKEVVRTILMSDDFDASAEKNEQVKSPTELFVGTIRALNASADGRGFADYGYLTGQSLFYPPNVAGWPAYTKGAQRWVNSGAYVGRLVFARDLAEAHPAPDATGPTWNHRAFFPATFLNADEVIDYLARRLAMPEPSAALRRAVKDYLAGMGPFRWNQDDVADRWGRGALRLMLSSPEYQLQ